MSKYKPGYVDVMVDGQNVKRYRDADGKYYRTAPGFGRQTIKEAFSGSGPAGLFGSMGSWNNRRVFGDKGQEVTARIQARIDSEKPKSTPKKGGMSNLGADYAKAELDLGQDAEDYRPGAGFPGQSRNVSRNGASGTQTSPSGNRVTSEAAAASFLKTLNDKYGISFDGQGARTPMESTALPQSQQNVMSGITAGIRANGTETPVMRGVTAGMDADKQTGSRMTEALADKESLRYKADPNQEISPEMQDIIDQSGPGLSARSRAFLDYDGPGGSMMALRAAEASQGYIRQGGRNYSVGEDGKLTEFSDKGRQALMKDGNNSARGEDFLKQYMTEKTTPAEAQSPDSGTPEFASRANYQQLSQKDTPGTLVMGEDNKPEPFENNMNRSAITGSPEQAMLTASRNVQFDMQEPPTRGFLPDEETIDMVKSFYLK